MVVFPGFLLRYNFIASTDVVSYLVVLLGILTGDS
jgi:hypothetical protein